MQRLRYNNAVGQLGASLAASAGPDTINFGSTAPPFATLVAPDYVPLILDPPSGATPNATFEVVALTAYTAAALTGTISRAQEGTTTQAHGNGAVWRCGPTVRDAEWLIRNVNIVTASGAAQTIPDPWTAGENLVTLTATCTLTLPAASAGKHFRLALQQDTAGSRTVNWPANVKWAAGTKPVLSTAPNVTDYLDFVCLDGTNWIGVTVALNVYKSSAAALTGTATSGAPNGSGQCLVTVPGTTQVGDYIFIFGAYVGAFNNGPGTPTGGGGAWTQLIAPFSDTNGTATTAVFYRVATAGDIGATITCGGFNNSFGGWAHLRSYTTGGVDTTLTASAAATSLSAPAPASGAANEVQVSFFTGFNGSATNVTSASLSAGSIDTTTQTSGRGCFAAEDWAALGASGSTITGGAFSYTPGSGPHSAGVAILLKPSAS